MTTGQNQRRRAVVVGTILFAGLVGIPVTQAQTHNVQRPTCNGIAGVPSPGCTPAYFFQGGTDGGDPVGGVTLAPNGSLYGTTTGGGVNQGTVYQLTPPAKAGGLWGYTLLYSFGTVPSDGIGPEGPLAVDSKGVLYGMVTGGGSASCGEIFTLTPPAIPGGAWAYNIIYNFLGGSDGCHPWWSGVVFGKNGVLYGTTSYGGSAANGGAGWGTVFELTPPAAPGGAWTESVLYAFAGGKDGGYPQASLLYTAGVLYGTAYTGGKPACGAAATEGCGVVFELKPKAGGGWKESVLHTFTGGNDGGLSSAPLIIKSGVLYGTTSQEDTYYQNGGDCTWGCGSVFALAPPVAPAVTWTETVLYHFQAPYAPPYTTCPAQQCDASAPVGGLVFGPNGSLYGTTAYGGPFSTGTIFELTPPVSPGGAWTEAVLYDESFDAGSGGYTSFPSSPFAGLTVGKKGVVYGTTTGDAGMVFGLKLN